MKRSLKIIIAFTFFITLWFGAISEETISFANKLFIPFVILAILGVISLGNILWKVKNLEEYPNQRIELEK